MDYDKTKLPETYAEGRTLSPETTEQWMNVVAEFLEPEGRRISSVGRELAILDLGCGTGRFSPVLAERFGARVLGVDPSDKMRRQAESDAPHPRVTYMPGCGERIPCDDESVDAVFLSMALHHLRSMADACHEMSRVLRPAGLVLVRAYLRECAPLLFWDFFPTARAFTEERVASAADVMVHFADAGFECVHQRTVRQQTDDSLGAHYERLKLRALSPLVLISDEEFHDGVEAMRLAAEAETEPSPVTEELGFLVFRKGDPEAGNG